MNDKIKQAKALIAQADAILITAGAGMGVDSGLPDFRGDEGFWKAYPPMKEKNLNFSEMANPIWFATDPNLAWAFYGHRLNLYRKTTPHKGFDILLDLVKEKDNNYFIYTSNVDGQFQKAGFDKNKIVETHGSIHHLQCSGFHKGIHSAETLEIEVDMDKFEAITTPLCEKCDDILRPNILMFSDWDWDSSRTNEQDNRYITWLVSNSVINDNKVVIIELGAGIDIPTIRFESRRIAKKINAKVIRINPKDFEIESDVGIGIELGALNALQQIIR
jgi:NAD-dependent SIR2 family protein deacetylase